MNFDSEERRIADRRKAERRAGRGEIDIYKYQIQQGDNSWEDNALTFVTVAVAIIWVRNLIDHRLMFTNWRIVNRFTDEVVETKEEWLTKRNQEKT